MRYRARHFDRQAQELIIVEPEHLDHHGEPGPKFRKTLGANGNRLVGARAQDFVSARIGKNTAHAGKIAPDARRVELLNYSFRDDALGHVVSPELLGQRCADLGADLFESRARIGYDRSQTIEQMNHTWMASVGHFIAGLGQALEIISPLIAQRIEFRGMNQRPRHAGEIPGQQRRNRGIAGLRARREVVLEVMVQGGLIDEIAAREFALRRRDPAVVEYRTDQQLQLELRTAGSSRPLARGRGQRGAGGISTNAEARGVDSKVRGVTADMAQRRLRVLHCGRKTVLGSQSIIHRHHSNAARAAQRAGDAVVSFHAAGDQAAAVEIDESGQHRGLRRRVETNAQCAVRARHGPILDRFERNGGAGKLHQRDESLAALLDRGAARIGRIARGEEIQEALDAWVERHPRAICRETRQALTEPTPAGSPPAIS